LTAQWPPRVSGPTDNRASSDCGRATAGIRQPRRFYLASTSPSPQGGGCAQAQPRTACCTFGDHPDLNGGGRKQPQLPGHARPRLTVWHWCVT